MVLVAITAKRLGGPTAGLVAGTITATTPILAAVARTNQPESFFVLALALVAWAATRAVQQGSLRWLLVAGGCVALAFQMYMMLAWAVWPALALAYLGTAQPWRRRVWHVLLAGVSSGLLSLVWVVVVTVTPASARPWVGGTNGNSAWEMVFGYNGLGRFADIGTSTDFRSYTPPYSGDPAALRSFSDQLAGQTAWFLPAALAAVVVLVALRRSLGFRWPVTAFLGGWSLTLLAMFSVVAGMHQFYTAAVAVPVGLLIGLAFAAGWQARSRWALISLVATAATTAIAVTRYTPAYLPAAVAAQAVAAVAAIGLIAWRFGRPAVGRSAGVAVLAVLGMVLTPTAWAVDVVNHPNSINPVAGDGSAAQTSTAGGPAAALGVRAPSGRGAVGAGPGHRTAKGGGAGAAGLDPAVLDYVLANRGGATYLLAAFGAQAASYYITATDGAAVLAVGGFGGGDPTPTLDAFVGLVSAGELRFVLAGGSLSTRAASTTTDQIRSWATANCAPVDGLPGLDDCIGSGHPGTPGRSTR